MDIGALTRITECTVQANGETWTVPAYWTDDEVVVYIATTIAQRKKKNDEETVKDKPLTSHGNVRH